MASRALAIYNTIKFGVLFYCHVIKIRPTQKLLSLLNRVIYGQLLYYPIDNMVFNCFGHVLIVILLQIGVLNFVTYSLRYLRLYKRSFNNPRL
jgi:hypothetical protein